MEHVHGLAKLSALYDKRDVGLRGSLCTGDDGDTASSECAEELAGNACRMLHVLTHDSHCSEVALHVHGEHSTILNLCSKFVVEHACSFSGVLIAYADRRGVL